MGNFSTTFTTSNVLAQEIIKMVEKMIDEYNFWSDPNICLKLEKILPDKIMEFSTKTNMTFGVRMNKSMTDKERVLLCKDILHHYKGRLNLMTLILNKINQSIAIIHKIKFGDVCAAVPKYVHTLKECIEFGGIWINEDKHRELKKKIKEDEVYNKWDYLVDELKGKYIKNLRALKKIILKLKNDIHKNDMNRSDYDTLRRVSIIRANRLVYVCEIYYLLTVNLLL